MKTRMIDFELDGSEIALEIEWSYSHDPGECNPLLGIYQPESYECEVIPPSDLSEVLKRYALDVMVPLWITQVESQCMDMELDETPADWEREERMSYEEDRAESMMVERRERENIGE